MDVTIAKRSTGGLVLDLILVFCTGELWLRQKVTDDAVWFKQIHAPNTGSCMISGSSGPALADGVESGVSTASSCKA